MIQKASSCGNHAGIMQEHFQVKQRVVFSFCQYSVNYASYILHKTANVNLMVRLDKKLEEHQSLLYSSTGG